MPLKDDTSTRFADEIRIISPWAYFIAVLAFVSLPTLLGLRARIETTGAPMSLLVAMGMVAGTLLAGFALLVGYVNKDAGRRGMNRVLWTLIAIFVPNALGIVLYFVLRKPRVSLCPQCGTAVEPGFGFCPGCRHRLNPVCPQCQRGLNAGARFCPYCGADLGGGALAATVDNSQQGCLHAE